ncbi:MAG: DUF4349 domain-containing protein [Anaerolineaceae bacterium]|nr:DUF4349 domain-containing protein [Anaerolineaceae bacterium]MBN2677978.1 DUF4349 domain-containing protein [Anaerolineaceae bacterium]
MKKKWFIVSLVVLLSLLSACAAPMESVESPVMDYSRANEVGNGAMPPAAPAQGAAEGYVASESDVSASNVAGTIERKILKNADLSIVVPDPAASMDRVIAMTDRMGGFVVSSNLYKTTTSTGLEVPYAYITIRVPANLLNDALREIKGQVENPDSDVLSESISGQDVTAEYTDLQSRLTNLELSEKKLQEFLDETTKAEDWLVAFNRLTEIRSQIEVLKGQIRYYDESAAMSAISINLQAKESIKPVTVGPWQPKGVALEAIQDLIDTMKDVYEGLLRFVLHTLPVLIVYIILIGGPIWFVIWLIRRIVKHFKKDAAPVSKKETK